MIDDLRARLTELVDNCQTIDTLLANHGEAYPGIVVARLAIAIDETASVLGRFAEDLRNAAPRPQGHRRE